MQSTLLSSFFVVTLTWFVRCDEYLKEAPAFLRACQMHGTDFDRCFSTALQNIYTIWKDGIPGLDSVGSLDPFVVKKLRVSQKSNNVDIKVQLKNVVTKGISQSTVKHTSIEPEDYTFKILINMPKIRVDAAYKLKGRILVLNLNGNGTLNTEISDIDYFITAKTNLIKRDGEQFFEISSITSDVKNIGGLRVHLSNLFNGNMPLEESANQLINENWRDYFQVMRPAIGQISDAVSVDRFKKVFNFIPARYFIDDLPR